MKTPDGLRRLADVAVRAGELPGDALTLSSTVAARPDTACSLCTLPLGHDPVFSLEAGRDGGTLLHAGCFSAWLDVVVTPTPPP